MLNNSIIDIIIIESIVFFLWRFSMVRASNFVPKYEIIMNKLIREISSRYKVGDLFYTQRDLMSRYDASYATIGRVLRELKEKDIIHCHVGKGIFIKNMPSAKALKTVRLVLFSHDTDGASDVTISGLYQKGIIEAQENLPCEIIFLRRTDNIDEMMAQFKKTSADGVLFLEDGLIALMEKLKKENVPYAIVHPTRHKHSFAADIDDSLGLREAVAALKERGAKKLFILGKGIGYGHNLLKVEACRAGMELAGLDPDTLVVLDFPKDDDLLTRIESVRNVLREHKDIDAIISIDPQYLEVVEAALKHEKIKVPNDVNVVSFGYHGYARSTLMPIGAVEVPHVEAGKAGVEILYSRCMDDARPSEIRLLKTKFIWVTPPKRKYGSPNEY
jgi:DNA-binding LacI/PurR family transcriptional regulator/DNA-binding transcriptional regulator YhcF (GntR family)